MSNPAEMTSRIPLTLIVAATPINGIGKAGALPWPMLKKEMAYFARVTKRVPQSLASLSPSSSSAKAQNAVIMGRKTWVSIPPKLRPLKERINVVVSGQSREALGIDDDRVVVESSIAKALSTLRQRASEGSVAPLGRTFIIGGASIYASALDDSAVGGEGRTTSVLITRIAREYECDTFFPVDLGREGAEGWRRKEGSELSGFVGEEVPEGQEEEVEGETVRWRYELWERE